MKLIAVACILFVASLSCNAQQSSPIREEILHKLEKTFQVSTVFTPDSPLLTGLLQSAKSANPSAPESTWQSLRPEFAASINAAMQNDDGATLRWLRIAFVQLSDFELERIARIYEDPVFAKAQQSMASTASQQEALRRNFVNARLMSAGINAVLSKHGMNEAH